MIEKSVSQVTCLGPITNHKTHRAFETVRHSVTYVAHNNIKHQFQKKKEKPHPRVSKMWNVAT